jgi:acyl-coenzyme A thioesterase PaaI-like protein
VAARPGDRLIAQASEASRTARLATYRIDVRRGDEQVASFGGTVYITGRLHDPSH